MMERSSVDEELAYRENVKKELARDLDAYRKSPRGRAEELARIKVERQRVSEEKEVRLARRDLRREDFRERHHTMFDLGSKASGLLGAVRSKIASSRVRRSLMDQRVVPSKSNETLFASKTMFGDVSRPSWLEEQPKGADHLFGKKKGGFQ